MADLINNYPVIASADLPDRPGLKAGCRVVLVDRGADSRERYVVLTATRGESGWHQGYYYSALSDARAKFDLLWQQNC